MHATPGNYIYMTLIWVLSSDDDVLIAICMQSTALMTFC